MCKYTCLCWNKVIPCFIHAYTHLYIYDTHTYILLHIIYTYTYICICICFFSCSHKYTYAPLYRGPHWWSRVQSLDKKQVLILLGRLLFISIGSSCRGLVSRHVQAFALGLMEMAIGFLHSCIDLDPKSTCHTGSNVLERARKAIALHTVEVQVEVNYVVCFSGINWRAVIRQGVISTPRVSHRACMRCHKADRAVGCGCTSVRTTPQKPTCNLTVPLKEPYFSFHLGFASRGPGVWISTCAVSLLVV